MAVADPPVTPAAPVTSVPSATDGADPAAPLLEKMTPLARELTQELRVLIREVMPQVTEKVHMGWEVIQFNAGGGMRGMIVALGFRPTYVNVEFADGTALPDPNHRLEGTGKRMRHVKVRSLDDVRHPDLRALLGAAARLRGLEPR